MTIKNERMTLETIITLCEVLGYKMSSNNVEDLSNAMENDCETKIYSITSNVVSSAVKAAEFWRKYMEEPENGVPDLIVSQLIKYTRLGCAVINNMPRQKAYLGRVVAVKNLPERCCLTTVKSSGDVYVLNVNGRHEEL